jgi:hypothetical protein
MGVTLAKKMYCGTWRWRTSACLTIQKNSTTTRVQFMWCVPDIKTVRPRRADIHYQNRQVCLPCRAAANVTRNAESGKRMTLTKKSYCVDEKQREQYRFPVGNTRTGGHTCAVYFAVGLGAGLKANRPRTMTQLIHSFQANKGSEGLKIQTLLPHTHN